MDTFKNLEPAHAAVKGGGAAPPGRRGWRAARAWGATSRGRLAFSADVFAAALAFAGVLGGTGHWDLLGPSYLVVGLFCFLGITLAPRWPWLAAVMPAAAWGVLCLLPMRPLEADGGSVACYVLAALSLSLGAALSRDRWVPWLATASAIAVSCGVVLGHGWFTEVFGAADARQIVNSGAPGEHIDMSPLELVDPVWSPEWLISPSPGVMLMHLAGFLGAVVLGLGVRALLRLGPRRLWEVRYHFRARKLAWTVWYVSVPVVAVCLTPMYAGPGWFVLVVAAFAAALVLAPGFPAPAAWSLAGLLLVTGVWGVPDEFLVGFDAVGVLWASVLLTVGIVAARLTPGLRTRVCLGALWFAGVIWWAGFDDGLGAVRQLESLPVTGFDSVTVIGMGKGALVGGFWLALAMVGGLSVRAWAEAVRGRAALATARAELEASEQDRARQDERRGIAGDVHDVLAHSLTVIVAQGEGALVSRGTEQQDAVRRMVDVARASLRDVRALIERLDGEDAALPSPGLANLPELIQNVRDAGLCLESEEFGERLPLGDSTELALYRILQEALTNVLTHGGRGATARLVLDWRGEDPGLTLTLASTAAPGAEPRPGTGLGLEGMRTRAAVAGGWLVTAHLPAVAEAAGVLR